MKIKTGDWLESKFRSMLPEKCYDFKPADFKSWIFLLEKYPELKNRMPRVPCDRIVIYSGRSYFFELKHTSTKYFYSDRVADTQIGSLLNHENLGGGKSFIVIGYHIGKKFSMFIIPINDFLVLTDDKRGLKVDDIRLKKYEYTSDTLITLFKG